MAIFGINIPLENIKKTSFVEGAVNAAFRCSDERKLLCQFLESKTSEGRVIVDELREISLTEAEKKLESGFRPEKDMVLDFVVSSLKTKSNGHLSVYDSLVRRIIEDQNPEFRKLHKLVDKGKFNGSLPFGYPDASKKAMGFLNAKIKNSLQDVEPEYLKTKLFGEKVRSLAKEMFYGINKLGFSGENLVRYLGIIFELSLLQSAPIENEIVFKNELAACLVNQVVLKLIHIKSLRYTYPGGERLDIIEHLNDVETKGTGQEKRFYHNEKIIIKRLGHVIDIFKFYGIKVNLTVLVADNDLEILFPKGNSLVSPEEVKRARTSSGRYLGNLQMGFKALTPDVCLLTDFLEKYNLSEYYRLQSSIFERLKKGDRLSLGENLIEERVNRQYGHYCDMFGRYSRSEARNTAYHQIANSIALGVVFRNFSTIPVVIIDNRGEENRFIGGLEPKGRVLFLTKLKEPTIIKKEK